MKFSDLSISVICTVAIVVLSFMDWVRVDMWFWEENLSLWRTLSLVMEYDSGSIMESVLVGGVALLGGSILSQIVSIIRRTKNQTSQDACKDAIFGYAFSLITPIIFFLSFSLFNDMPSATPTVPFALFCVAGVIGILSNLTAKKEFESSENELEAIQREVNGIKEALQRFNKVTWGILILTIIPRLYIIAILWLMSNPFATFFVGVVLIGSDIIITKRLRKKSKETLEKKLFIAERKLLNMGLSPKGHELEAKENEVEAARREINETREALQSFEQRWWEPLLRVFDIFLVVLVILWMINLDIFFYAILPTIGVAIIIGVFLVKRQMHAKELLEKKLFITNTNTQLYI